MNRHLNRLGMVSEADLTLTVMRRCMAVDPSGFDVSVKDGVVRVRGELQRRSEVSILASLAGDVEGVIAVDPVLSYRFDDSHDRAPKERRRR